MAATLIDGKRVAGLVRTEVAEDVARLKAAGVEPGLAVVLVGDDPASQVYVRNKDRAALEAGFRVETLRLPAGIAQAELEARVGRLNDDPRVHGILVQLPLPRGLDDTRVVHALAPEKDVDGLHRDNVGRLWRGEEAPRPCTPAGCIELCERYGVPLEGAHAVVLGRSQLVGKPLAAMLLERNATVTVAHSRSRQLDELCRTADVLFAAVGRLGLVRGSWVRPGACVIDVGINRTPDGRLAGDVAFDEVFEVAGWVTPVPGGVGPMTIAMLLRNTVRAAGRALARSVPPAAWRGSG
jgi:methylenetetrahydrofolate dehydrogenase (NADP+)/methenyltetrahydrofolate cyclohydrolase